MHSCRTLPSPATPSPKGEDSKGPFTLGAASASPILIGKFVGGFERIGLSRDRCADCRLRVEHMAMAKRAKDLGITRVPAVVVNGKLASCCAGAGPNEADLRAARVGSTADPGYSATHLSSMKPDQDVCLAHRRS